MGPDEVPDGNTQGPLKARLRWQRASEHRSEQQPRIYEVLHSKQQLEEGAQ